MYVMNTLFQIEFDTHVAQSLRVIPKELPSVDEKIAITTGKPEVKEKLKSYLNIT